MTPHFLKVLFKVADYDSVIITTTLITGLDMSTPLL